MDKKIAKKLKFKASSNNKGYKVESICNSVVYTRKLNISHLSSPYYLVS